MDTKIVAPVDTASTQLEREEVGLIEAKEKGNQAMDELTAKSALVSPITIALSRDELLVVLNTLQVETIPGIDVEPTGDWAEQEKAIASLVATRSLRARGLAKHNIDGGLAIHTDLLTAVGVCAHSQSAAFIFHWAEKEVAPARCFGHICDDELVLHTRVDDVIHLFTRMPSKPNFLSQLMAFCNVDRIQQTDAEQTDDGDIPVHEFRIPAALFAGIRNSSDLDAAVASLNAEGVELASAQALVDDLHAPYSSSILQTIQQTDSDTAVKRDFTILGSEKNLWLVAAESATEDGTLPLLVKSTTQDELVRLLDAWL